MIMRTSAQLICTSRGGQNKDILSKTIYARHWLGCHLALFEPLKTCGLLTRSGSLLMPCSVSLDAALILLICLPACSCIKISILADKRKASLDKEEKHRLIHFEMA
jgi:hypothetical protein